MPSYFHFWCFEYYEYKRRPCFRTACEHSRPTKQDLTAVADRRTAGQSCCPLIFTWSICNVETLECGSQLMVFNDSTASFIRLVAIQEVVWGQSWPLFSRKGWSLWIEIDTAGKSPYKLVFTPYKGGVIASNFAAYDLQLQIGILQQILDTWNVLLAKKCKFSDEDIYPVGFRLYPQVYILYCWEAYMYPTLRWHNSTFVAGSNRWSAAIVNEVQRNTCVLPMSGCFPIIKEIKERNFSFSS